MNRYFLVVEQGGGTGPDRFELPGAGVLSIGRSRDAVISMPAADPKISGKHATLEVRGSALYVVDQSRNGTFVDGKKITTASLTHGQRLSVGGCTLRFEVQRAPPSMGEVALRDVDLATATVELSASELESVRELVDPASGGPSSSRPVLRRFGPFDLLNELGRGGFGAVYRARHRAKGQTCALKLLHPGNRESADAVRRFLREQEVLHSLTHPSIVGFVEAGEVLGVHYLATEFVGGGTLDRLAPCADRRQVAALARDLFEAVAHMHARRTSHRDLKPANVLLTTPGPDGLCRAKVTDLGFAKAFDGGLKTRFSPALTASGSAGGTLRWSAPEQINDFSAFLPSGDVYGAAATIFHLLTGQSHLAHPRPVHELSLVEQYRLVIEGPRVPLLRLRPDAPALWAATLDALLAVRPDARLSASAASLAAIWA